MWLGVRDLFFLRNLAGGRIVPSSSLFLSRNEVQLLLQLKTNYDINWFSSIRGRVRRRVGHFFKSRENRLRELKFLRFFFKPRSQVNSIEHILNSDKPYLK